jgi:cell division protein FtsL
MLYAKNEEISALKLSIYCKDKENDELKLKISELESEVQVKNSPICNDLIEESSSNISESKQGKIILQKKTFYFY